MDKENEIHIHNGIVFSLQKEILPFSVKWIDVEGIMLKEMSKTNSL